jgi:PIN domain nuclease of toxin-antitoxin system
MICVSAGSICEIAIKISLGKLVLTQPYLAWMTQALSDLDITVLPITVEF